MGLRIVRWTSRQKQLQRLIMSKFALFMALAVSATLANAEVFKCEGANGKIQFSDTACTTGSRSKVLPDRAPITAQQQQDAQQRNQRLQSPAAESGGETLSAQASPPAQTQDARPNDADAVANCVRDVERRGASQNVKAELIAACQSAGRTQRSTNQASSAVDDCVRNVERTGASEKDKSRQIAVCHGGDVKPEPVLHVRDQNKLK